MGAIEGNSLVSDNDWEAVKRGGDAAIARWISDQLSGTSCTVVLVGTQTAGRKWITHEIKESWNRGNGVVGIHIHGLKDRHGNQTAKGSNPFDGLVVDGKHPLSSIARLHDTPFATSDYVYGHIKENLVSWVDEAIAIRGKW